MNEIKVIQRPSITAFSRSHRRIGVAVVILGMVFSVPCASAAESASFRLYDSFPNVSDPAPDASDSFQMNENGVTWFVQPLSGSNFQIVLAPPAVSSSTSSVSSVSTSSVPTASPSTGGHRGKRMPPVLHPAAEGSSSAQSSVSSVSRASSSVSSMAGFSSASAGMLPPPPPFTVDLAQPLAGQEIVQEAAAHPLAPCGKCQCPGVRLRFRRLRVGEVGAPSALFGLVCAVVEVLFILLAFCLFLICRKRSR